MKIRSVLSFITCSWVCTVGLLTAKAQPQLPRYEPEKIRSSADWLVQLPQQEAALYQDSRNHLVLSNGLITRTFSTSPNGATIGLDNLMTGEAILRSVRPEAELVIDGDTLAIGGLTGQPVHNYLLPEWLEEMSSDTNGYQLTGTEWGEIQPRFSWQKRREWMPRDLPWPAPGLFLTFHYRPHPALLRQRPALEGVEVSVHYELYDGLPLLCKWISVENKGQGSITLNRFKSEILAAVEAESVVDGKQRWQWPNITIDTDYRFGGMSDENVYEASAAWNKDPLYSTQVNYERTTPCLLECYPKIGPDIVLAPGETFTSFRTWELFHDSRDQERQGLAIRRMHRVVAPWVTENPILMHVRQADDASVRKAIDQCAEVGFELVIMTFGSGFNLEDTSSANIDRMRALADYAHARGIALGGYSLLASRQVGGGNDVVMPEGRQPRFGNSPCLESRWGQAYFQTLYRFYDHTGMDVLEHDGSYPGDICAATDHPGHRGLDDSQWRQFQRIQAFYHWCRSRGIYLNVPDCYFLNGSNKTGMGYRETNWSLPRAQQEIIERQNVYDGTWTKTPSMGWMFVPLVEYHGGGPAATIEPLREHLPHYEQRLANLFGAGVQACYRGPQLYDAPETKAIVKKWVDFYKTHRRILDGDIIHVRRPDGRDYDAILHVDPAGEEKGLLMVYNPLEEPIKRTLQVNLYYTGLTDAALVMDDKGQTTTVRLGRNHGITLPVEVPAKGQIWMVFKQAP